MAGQGAAYHETRNRPGFTERKHTDASGSQSLDPCWKVVCKFFEVPRTIHQHIAIRRDAERPGRAVEQFGLQLPMPILDRLCQRELQDDRNLRRRGEVAR
jgi:hypothetical protein